MKRVVPFFPLKQGSRGRPVLALRRAVSHYKKGKFLKWVKNFSPIWGPFFTRTIKKVQKDLGVPVTGRYDKATHAKLAPYYDAYSIKYLLVAQKKPETKEEMMRKKMLASLLFLYNNRMSIPYRQWRAYKQVRPLGDIPGYGDCSGSGAGCAWGTDMVKNFTGFSGWGYGNTNTFTAWFEANGCRVNLSELELCDVVMYNGHVAWVVGWENGQKTHPLVYSFGSYPARILRYNYRTDFVGFYKLKVA